MGARDDERSFGWQRTDVCRLARGLVPRVAGRDCAASFTASDRRTRRRPRKCSSTAATSSIQRAARCSTTTRLRSRGRMELAARADFCARAAERAVVARLDRRTRPTRTHATARTSSASSNQFNRMSCWVASEIVRITDDAQMRLSMLKRFIELAQYCATCRTCTACTSSTSASTSGPAAVDQVGSATPDIDQLCDPKSNSAADARAAALRARSGRGRRLTMRACST